MDVNIPCEKCHRLLVIPSEFLGKQVQCGACGHLQTAQAPFPAGPAGSGDQRRARTDEAVTAELADAGSGNRAAEEPRRGDAYRPRRPRDEEEEDDRRFRRIDCPYCREPISSAARGCRWCGKSIDPDRIEEDLDRLKRERTRQNLLSFAFGVPGLVLLVAGQIARVGLKAHGWEYVLMGSAVVLLGAALFVVGGIFYAKYKGQHPALGLLVLAGCIGLIVLLSINDKKGKQIRRLKRFLCDYD
jgi:hypothetical protein